MKLLYIANARIPTEKAHGVNIVHTVSALVEAGADVLLVLPKRINSIDKDIYSYYGVKEKFDVEYVPIFDFVNKGFFGYWITQLSFSFALLRRRWKKQEYIILTRDEWSGWLLSLFGYQVYYDMHGFPVKWVGLWKRSMRMMKGIICTNNWKIKQCEERFGIPKDRLILARNGFDAALFHANLTKEEARVKLLLDQDKKIVMYTGHLYDWKGVDMLAKTACLLPEVLFVFVGGSPKEKKEFENRVNLCNNVLLLGQKPHSDIPLYLMAADVLALPNSAKSSNPRFAGYSVFDTSPIKMFEYMASGRPIVASNLPSIAEVLNDRNAILVEVDNRKALSSGIKRALTEDVSCVTEKELQDVQEYTWEKRAVIILDFMQKK